VSKEEYMKIIVRWRMGNSSTDMDLDIFAPDDVAPVAPPTGKGPAGKGPAGKGPAGKGPAGKGPAVAPAPRTQAELMEIFDVTDSELDGTGFVPRSELEQRFTEWGSLATLRSALREGDTIILERDQFADIVRAWLNPDEETGQGPAAQSAGGKYFKDAPSVAALLAIFDTLDEESSGFAPRMDLADNLQGEVDNGEEILSDLCIQVKALPNFVVDKEDFQGLLDAWAGLGGPVAPGKGPAGKGPAGKGPAGKGPAREEVAPAAAPEAAPAAAPDAGADAGADAGPRVTRQELIALFDEADADKAGFVSKRELKPHIKAKHKETGDEELLRLVKMLDGLENSLVEKAEFRQLLLAWDKDNIDAKKAREEAEYQNGMRRSK